MRHYSSETYLHAVMVGDSIRLRSNLEVSGPHLLSDDLNPISGLAGKDVARTAPDPDDSRGIADNRRVFWHVLQDHR